MPASGIDIDGFRYLHGGFSAFSGFPHELMRPPVDQARASRVTFTNLDALPGEPNTEQVWHSDHLLPAPCNQGSGIGYPLANGPIKFDSGQLGYGTGPSSEVTTGSNVYTTPPLTYRPEGKRQLHATSAGSTRSCAARSGSASRRTGASRRGTTGPGRARLSAHPATANRSHSPGAPLRV